GAWSGLVGSALTGGRIAEGRGRTGQSRSVAACRRGQGPVRGRVCNSRQTEGRAVHLQSRTRHRSRNPCRPCRGHGASGTRGSPPMKTVQTSNRNAALRALVAIAVLVALAAALFLFAPEEAYNWIKAIHVIAVISWMAGMLYLPRLFVYHADAEKG